MKNDFHKDKIGFYAKGLMAVTVLLGALTFVRVAGFLTASSEARAMAARVDPNGQNAGTSTDVSKLLASAKAGAEELKKKNLFVVTPPRQNPVNEVLGILGDEALINGKWCKVGDSVGDAKIIAIDPTKVKIVWDGQEKEFSPITASGGGQAERPGPSRPTGKPGPPGKPQMVVTGAGGGVAQAEQGLSAGKRDQMREQWQSMSPEERQRAREEMRQRLGAKPK